MQIVFDEPYATLMIDTKNGILVQKWNGYAKVDEFKKAIDETVACFRNYSLHYILSDTTDQAVLAKEGSDYAASVMPDLLENGMKKVAFVLPKSVFAQVSITNFTRETDKSIVRRFTSREDALAWLKG